MTLCPREPRAEGRCRPGLLVVKKVQNNSFVAAGPGVLYRVLETV